MTQTASRKGFYPGGGWAVGRVRTGVGEVAAGLRHGDGREAVAGGHPGTRCPGRDEGDREGEAAVRGVRVLPGFFVLRGWAGGVLAASPADADGHLQSHRGLFLHRGQPPGAAGQDGSAGCEEAGLDAAAVLGRGEGSLERGPRAHTRAGRRPAPAEGDSGSRRSRLGWSTASRDCWRVRVSPSGSAVGFWILWIRSGSGTARRCRRGCGAAWRPRSLVTASSIASSWTSRASGILGMGRARTVPPRLPAI